MLLGPLAASILASGCSSVQVDRGKDLSSAGIAYAKATDAVIEHALGAAIDTSSYKQVSDVSLKGRTKARRRRARTG